MDVNVFINYLFVISLILFGLIVHIRHVNSFTFFDKIMHSLTKKSGLSLVFRHQMALLHEN